MTTLRLSQEIDRPVRDVFDVVIHAGDFASWNPTIRSSRQLSPGEVGEGTTFEWSLRGFGDIVQELQEFEVDRRVRIVPHHRSLSGGHRFLFTDLGERTRVDHELEMTAKGIFKLLAPIMNMVGRKNLRATADALAERLRP